MMLTKDLAHEDDKRHTMPGVWAALTLCMIGLFFLPILAAENAPVATDDRRVRLPAPSLP